MCLNAFLEKKDIYEDEAKDLSSVNISREHLAEMREIAIAGLRVLSKGQVEAKLEQWAEKAGIKVRYFIVKFSIILFKNLIKQ